jgi:hypothetical protein
VNPPLRLLGALEYNIGRAAGLEGRNMAEYAMSQMLMAEGEDLYALMLDGFYADAILKLTKSASALLVRPPFTGTKWRITDFQT